MKHRRPTRTKTELPYMSAPAFVPEQSQRTRNIQTPIPKRRVASVSTRTFRMGKEINVHDNICNTLTYSHAIQNLLSQLDANQA